MIRKNYFLTALTCLVIAFLSCNDGAGEDPNPELTEVELATTDFQFTDGGMARVENLDPRDIGNPDTTHVNYAVAITTTDLVEVTFGEKTFFQIDPNDQSDVITGLVFNLYSPIEVAGGTAADNVLGTANQRVFQMETFAVPGQIANDYFYVEASLSILDRTDFDNTRAFAVTGGTVTVSGTAPNFEISLDVTIRDDSRNIEGTLTGTVSPGFRIIENN